MSTAAALEPELHPVYCRGCGRHAGAAPTPEVRVGGKTYARQPVLFCTDPACLYTPPGSEQDDRDSIICQLFAEGFSPDYIRGLFGLSRQRIFQIRAGR